MIENFAVCDKQLNFIDNFQPKIEKQQTYQISKNRICHSATDKAKASEFKWKFIFLFDNRESTRKIFFLIKFFIVGINIFVMDIVL